MSAKLTSDTGRRKSLRVITQALPLAFLRTEDSGVGHDDPVHADTLPGSDMKDKMRTDTDHVTPLPDDASQSHQSTTTLTSSKSRLPVNNPQAHQHQFELYKELHKIQTWSHLPIPAGCNVVLPLPTKPRTLIFDLDETLVHRQAPDTACETILTVEAKNGNYLVGLSIRPYVGQILAELEKTWELIVFTASQKSYADAVIDYIDPEKRLITHRLYRDHCTYVDGKAVKDLRILHPRSLSSIVIVDNSILSFAYQLSNGIPISSWRGSLRDRELLKLNRFLKKLAGLEDVRVELQRTFDLEHFCQNFRRSERHAAS